MKSNSAVLKIRQGAIVNVRLDPSEGHEQSGTRPAVVLSSAGFHVSQLCIIAPLTSSIREYVGDVILKPTQSNNLKHTSEVLCGHIRSVGQSRIDSILGSITVDELNSIFSGIDMILGRA